MSTQIVKVGPTDMLRQMSSAVYRKAYAEGLSLSAYLEREMPSHEYRDGLDAYSRLLMEANIRVNSSPDHGVQADTFDAFYRNDQTRALLPEFIARCWRRAATGLPYNTRGLFQSGDSAENTVDNPTTFASMGRITQQIAPAIPLASLVALTTGIDSGSYEAFYLTEDATQERKVRVGEGAEIPRAKMVGGDHVIRLKKYGRVLEATYEQMRRQRIDRVAMTIQLMAVRAEIDKVAAVIDVIVNGDGNSGTAATNYNLTTLDTAAVAGTLTLKGWIAFKMKFANPYTLTVALANEAVVLQMMLLNSGSANIPLAFMPTSIALGGFRAINPGLADGVGVGWTTDAPSLKIVGIDSRFAIERIFEIGGTIEEIERFTTRQTEALTMTEVEGYMTFDAGAVKTLNVNA